MLVAATALLFYLYLTRRHIPAKYLVPGTLFLIAFQIFPVLYTVEHRLHQLRRRPPGQQGRGDRRHPGRLGQAGAGLDRSTRSPIATKGDPATGRPRLPAHRPDDRAARSSATADGLEPLDAGDVDRRPDRQDHRRRRLHRAQRRPGRRPQRGHHRPSACRPTRAPSASQGLSRAFEGRPPRRTTPAATASRTPRPAQTWTADDANGSFVDRRRRAPGPGLEGQRRLPQLRPGAHRPGISGALPADPGLELRLRDRLVGLHVRARPAGRAGAATQRLRGQRLYRSLLILPYAMPSFAMLLVWRDMFNTDFGLINRLFGLNVNWFGTHGRREFAVILVQLWLGYPYMFLVCTGALQAIPAELTEAAAVDGAKPWHAFRTVTLPLLLVALAPLLISSFAFNFNNFNAIYLITEGGPFPAGQPDRRRHRPADHLHLPAGVRRAAARSTASPPRSRSSSSSSSRWCRSSASGAPTRWRRCTDEPDIAAVETADRERRTRRAARRAARQRKGSWFRQVGWRHLVGMLALCFALFPIVFVVSAALNPLGTLASAELVPDRGEPRELHASCSPTPRSRLVPQLDAHRAGRRVRCRMFISALRRVRLLPHALHGAGGSGCCRCCWSRCSRSSWRSWRST